MAQQAEAPYQYKEGTWEWDDPDHGGWAKFDPETSKQIESELKKKIDTGKYTGNIEIPLNKGSYFSKQPGVYAVVLILKWNGTYPVIDGARQTNVKTKFKRSIRRLPPLDAPLTAEEQKLVDQLKGKWEWKDDHAWKEYPLEVVKQLETAFLDRKRKVNLTTGPYFSKHPNQYYVEFNYISFPASAQQMNRNTKYGRWVRRIPHKSEHKKVEHTKQQEFFLKKNKHFLMMKHYAPLSTEDFQDQEQDDMLKQNLKCPLCLEQFSDKNLLECIKINKKLGKVEVNPEEVVVVNSPKMTDDEKADQQELERKKKNAKRRHRFKFENKARKFVTDETVVGLNKCTYGHYFHAACILQSLNRTIECPVCKQAYGPITGTQPDGRMYVTKQRTQCSGFDDVKDTVKLMLEFPGGIQSEHHQNPGKPYFGDLREAFFPNNKEGRKWTMLIRLAFERRLIFHVGRSESMKKDNRIVFGSIHLKTSTTGGTEKHGYPDEKYFDNLRGELAVKGITESDIDKMEQVYKDFIEKGFPEDQK